MIQVAAGANTDGEFAMKVFDRFKNWLKTRKWNESKTEIAALIVEVAASARDGNVDAAEWARIAARANTLKDKLELTDWK